MYVVLWLIGVEMQGQQEPTEEIERFDILYSIWITQYSCLEAYVLQSFCAVLVWGRDSNPTMKQPNRQQRKVSELHLQLFGHMDEKKNEAIGIGIVVQNERWFDIVS